MKLLELNQRSSYDLKAPFSFEIKHNIVKKFTQVFYFLLQGLV